MAIRIGVDIGGTFTDFCLVDDESQRVYVHKRLTTPHDPSAAVLDGFREMLCDHHIRADAVDGFVHGSTLVANSIIERRGAKTALLVTKGFADLLDIGLERRYDLYDLRLRFPTPLVPRNLRFEVDERIYYDGSIQRELSPIDKERALSFVRENAIEAVAICFLHSYVNPIHERELVDYLSKNAPGLYVSTSSGVFPYIREYERWTTTTMNSFVQPVVDRYLGRLENGLRELGFQGNFHIVTSSGGTITPDAARRFPVRTLESGPAAGVLMAAFIGRSISKPDLLAYDMGGTTAKGALVRRYAPAKKYDMEVARIHGFKKGSGLPAKFPTIDMIEIGSGGGSIASIDERGVLRMGPRSAGAEPGPACYGRGGPYATLTDANLVLGYLDPEYFLGGKMRLDGSASETVIASSVASHLGIDVARAAWGMHEVINEDVARAFRVHASERGFDYRQCSMVAFGGSGPAHALRIARKLRIPAVIFPVGAGVMSAFGMLASPLTFEVARTHRVRLSKLDESELDVQFHGLIDEAASFLSNAGLERNEINVTRRLDMRFCGQGYEVEVELPADLDNVWEAIPALFRTKYEQIFGNPPIGAEAEILNWKVEARGPQPTILENCRLAHERRMAKPKAFRRAYFPESGGFIDCAVFDRYALEQGQNIQGPALIEESESTCVIGVNDRAIVDDRGNIVACLNQSERAVAPRQDIPMGIDPIQLGILWDRLISITDEIVEALVRTSFSTNVRESYDLSCILFDRRGRSLAQGTYSMPTFTGTAPETLRHMIEKFPAESLRPGDVLLTNDPWQGTGHLFDINVARPVFRGALLIGFTMTITHLPDIGGTGFSTVAREVYEEGLRIPICKICNAGVLDQRLLEIIRANVRVNEAVVGDIAANIASNEVGSRLLLELLDDYGLSDLDDLSDSIIQQSEREMEKAIERIPDGQYRNELKVESADEMITLSCTITVKGHAIVVDFSGSSGCIRAGFNVPLCYSSAMAQYSLKCVTLPEIPNNWGSIAPITVTAPPGCVLNAQPPWPTAGRHVIGHFVTPLIFGALSSVVPDRVHADPGMIDLLNVQGTHRDGTGLSNIYFAAGGYGALHDADGPHTTPSPSNMSGISTEVWEQQTSVTIEEKSLLTDSGGAGKQRGGLGQKFVLRNDTADVLVVSAFAQRTEIPPAGFEGGKPGRCRAHLLNSEPVHSRRRYVLQVGDRLTAIECGGGGFGDPRLRPVEAVIEDWSKGFISTAGALHDYGVRIDDKTGTGARVSTQL